MTERLAFRIAQEDAGQRVDRLIAARDPRVSRRVAAELCRSGCVRIDGRAARKGELARAGSEISVVLPELASARPDPDVALAVVLERDDLVVVDKPAGQPTAPLSADERGTLANGLVARYPELAPLGHGALEPGLLHRLDTHTSGLLLAARTARAFETLHDALHAGRLTKRYLAVIAEADIADHGEITLPIAPHPHKAKRVVACQERMLRGARAARTAWRVVRRGPRYTLLEITVSRAVRHQIRVHFAALGHPLVGDAVYGGAPHPALGGSHALHASYIEWAGDEVVAGFAVTAPVPAGMGVLLEG